MPVAWPVIVPRLGVGARKLEAPAAFWRTLFMLAAVLMVPTFSPALTGAGGGAGGAGGGGGGAGIAGACGAEGARHMILIV
jgi:hypothetical protein